MITTQTADGMQHQFPDGTSDAAIDKAMKAYAASPSPAQAPIPASLQVDSPADQWGRIGAENMQQAGIRPTTTGQTRLGALMSLVPFNLGDEAVSAARAAGDTLIKGGSYAANYDNDLSVARDAQSRFSSEHPILNFGLSLPANILTALALGPTRSLAGTVTQGAGFGGAAGFGGGQGGFGNRAESAVPSALLGAATAGALGTAGNYVIQKAVPAAARGAQYVQSIINKSGVAPAALATAASSKPLTSAEMISPQAQTNLMALARREGQTGADLQAQMTQRAASRPDRIMDDMAAAAGIHPEAARGNMDDILAQGRAAAAPLYQEAFSGGSTAPLQSQLEDQFATASAAHAKAVQAVQDAQNGATLASSRFMPSDNVYASSSSATSQRAADQQLTAAQQAEEQAAAAKQSVLDKLQASQSDSSNGVNGGVWSPRIQQFLDSPDVKAGLARGIKIQAREALASGQPFNPTEYAITGFDGSGNPVVGNVPNLRLLDAAKRGMDSMLEDFRDPVTGKMTWNEDSRSLDSVRRSFVNAVDDVAPPVYQQARQVSSDYLSANAAFQAGQKAILNPNVTAQQFADAVAKMSPTDVEALKGGIANKVFDLFQQGRFQAKQSLTPLAQAKMTTALGPDQANSFLGNLQSEAEMQAFERRAIPSAGSQTAPLNQAMQDQDNFGGSPMLNNVAAQVMTKGPKGAALSAASNWAVNQGQGLIDKLRTSGLNVPARDAAGQLLMLPPADLAAALRAAQSGPVGRGAVIGQTLNRSAIPASLLTSLLLSRATAAR